MHWLLLLSILASTTGVKPGADAQSANRLVENALRQKLGGARKVQVELAPAPNHAAGDFDRIVVNLDGFSADRLEGAVASTIPSEPERPNTYPPDGYSRPKPRSLDKTGIEDILDGVLNGGKGGSVGGGDLGNILGGLLRGGRIGRLQFRATNFSYGGAQYDALSADLGEIRFDWAKALRGEMDVKSVQPGTLALALQGDQAAKLLAPRLPQLDNLKVSFRDGRAFLAARSNFYGLRLPFEVGARLTVTRNQVIASDWGASLANVKVPGLVLDEITERANPLYDFDPKNRWPIAVDLQTAGTTNNALALRGGLRWLGFNRGAEPDQRRPVPSHGGRGDGTDIFDIFGKGK